MNQDDRPIIAKMQSAPEGTTFYVLEEHNAQLERDRLEAKLNRLAQEESMDWRVHVEFPQDRFSQHRMRVAWLKAGYLALFALLGYNYTRRA